MPLLVNSYLWITHYKDIIYSSSIMPYFQISESIIENKIKIIIKEYKTTNSLMLKQLILEDINENWSECEHIFTDIINNRTGCTFYHKNLNYKKN